MELRHLRYYLAVAEARTVSRAAVQLRVSQPTLSRQIHDLESELGVKLFERTGRNLRLTGAGEDLLAYVRRVNREVEAFGERARALQRGDTGVLHVGATPQTLQRLFPAVLTRCRRIMPGVDVRLIEAHPAALFEVLRNGELHIALTAHAPEFGSAFHPAGVAPIFAVGMKTDGRQRDRIEVSALEDVPLLLMQRGFATRDLFDAACRVARVRQNIFLESSAPATLTALVKAGCGVAILPGTVSLKEGGVKVQRLTQNGTPLTIHLAVHWNPQRFLPPYAQRFAEELAALARNEFARHAGPRNASAGAPPSRRRR